MVTDSQPKTPMVPYVIAERQVLARLRSGEMRAVKLQIGLPEPVEQRWIALIALEGLYPNAVKVPGVDSFQCLNLAFGVVRTALEKFVEAGGQLYWKDGSGPLGLADIFA